LGICLNIFHVLCISQLTFARPTKCTVVRYRQLTAVRSVERTYVVTVPYTLLLSLESQSEDSRLWTDMQ
jgi:hypothetical protein